jgi:hypothetical protein
MYASGLSRLLYHEVAAEGKVCMGTPKYKSLCGRWFWPHFTNESLDGIEQYGCKACKSKATKEPSMPRCNHCPHTETEHITFEGETENYCMECVCPGFVACTGFCCQ